MVKINFIFLGGKIMENKINNIKIEIKKKDMLKIFEIIKGELFFEDKVI